MGKRVGGTAYVKVNGRQYELTGNAEAPLMDKVRETKMGSAGVAGYTEKARLPYIKGTFVLPPGFPLREMQEATDAVVTVDFANGMSYVLTGAYVVGEPALGSDEGESEIEWNGNKGRWL